ncbi:MAG: LysR family transcriptional regulator [Paracoccus sp. (in: a-proteobacteria)]|uniref:LysR family transcriptional regulator n=1 Tax=Paracoccus sp. TaxID=267 RepID=UPI0039E4CDC1
MFTIKQLEALYWADSLGGFQAAADYLHVTQSTISKRIAELEQQFPEPLFMRDGRQAVLTVRGESVRDIAQQMLRLNDQLIHAARGRAPLPPRTRLGTTDLVATSWLPRLLDAMAERFPHVEVEPEISLTSTLMDGLTERKIDFVICPRSTMQPQFINAPLGDIQMAWMCSPALMAGRMKLSLEELLSMTLLAQSPGSVLRPVLYKILENEKLRFRKRINCNNMGALAEMAANGLGITILPPTFFSHMVQAGRLVVVDCPLHLPALTYYITYRNDYHREFYAQLAALCDEIRVL